MGVMAKQKWQDRYADKVTTAAKAVACVKPGDRVFVGSGAGELQVLADNHGMLHLFHKCGYPVESSLENNIFCLRIPFKKQDAKTK